LDEEVEVSVLTLRFKPLNELFDNDSASIEIQDKQKEITNMQICFTHQKDIQNFQDFNNDAINKFK